MAVTGFASLFFVLAVMGGGHPVMAPAHLAAGAAAAAHAYLADAPAEKIGADDVVLLHLHEVKGLDARGRILACRTGGEWKSGADCPAALVAGRELRVFTGIGGEIARWTVAEGPAQPDVGRPGLTVGGKLNAPLLDDGGDDPLRTPLALFGAPRHLVETPVVTGYAESDLTGVLEAGRRYARMNLRMSAGMKVLQYAVANLTPTRRDLLIVAGSTYTGPLAQAPKPSSSLLAVRDPGAAEDWVRKIESVVSFHPQSLRKLERYHLVAILDVDGDGFRELLIRGQSDVGDRFALLTLRDDDRFVRLADWAGVQLVDASPRNH